MDKLDPDYASYNSALEHNAEEDKKENLIKFTRILEGEYNKEIIQRQEQIEQIELQIFKVRKLLHLLRYALIMSYYKKKELEYNGDDEASSDCLTPPDKQNRIHPAVKKLLGKNHIYEQINLKNKRKTQTSREVVAPETKRVKVKLDVVKTTPKNNTPNFDYSSITNRKKSKHRIIVGNVSKWMPSSEDDLLTHKWMIYVRAAQENSDLGNIVEKVVFYLHPSYKPHDIVEVCEKPFHLTRRGWGEFPVRVQIVFKVKANKPIDIVHNLKLDKTYTGRQTLGCETVVDLFLYEAVLEFKQEALEHDYCSDVSNSQEATSDHNYAFALNYTGPLKLIHSPIQQDQTNPLIYGLEKYIEHDKKPTKIIVFAKNIISNFNNKIINNEGENYKIAIVNNRFKNMGEALHYLFKKLPLCTDLANENAYKRQYPFTAPSLKDFVTWNVGKRRNSEWSRAKVIKKLVCSAKIKSNEQWSTKAILMYGRSHSFASFIKFGLFTRPSAEKKLLLSCFADSTNHIQKPIRHQIHEENITVNVDSICENKKIIKTTRDVQDLSDPHTKLECSFIRQTALDYGIILKSEDLDEGSKINGAEIVILQAIKCLAESLIRRANNHKVCTKTINSSTFSINREDVELAINERMEIVRMRNAAKKLFF